MACAGSITVRREIHIYPLAVVGSVSHTERVRVRAGYEVLVVSLETSSVWTDAYIYHLTTTLSSLSLDFGARGIHALYLIDENQTTKYA